MLAIEIAPSDDGHVDQAAPRYTLKADPFSSHSIILDWLADGHGRRLLDVGAADGLLGRHLTERGWKVTGIEADPAMAAAGAAHCERMLVADLNRAVPTLDGLFDVIVCGDVLEHLADPPAVLRALLRALAPGGDVVVSVPNVAHLWVRLSLLAGRFDYADRGILDRTHLRFFTRKTLVQMINHSGLKIVSIQVTPIPLELVSRFFVSPLGKIFHAVFAKLTSLFPTLLGYQFIVEAKKP
jgi:2-polyprenyl-3-methyl-5-hydroxy-6-metoxy-1,4-benzoquinol methylase